MKTHSIFILIVTFIIMAGCQKDLEIANPNALTIANFWQTEADAVRGVNAVYSTLHRGAISRWQWFYYEIRSDVGRSTSPDPGIVNNMDQFNINDNAYGNTVGVWADNYVGIFRANQVLDNVPDMDIDDNLKERIIGEAYFLRGLFYYHLATLFGNVPLQLETSSPEDLPSTSSQQQVFAQIESDLMQAADRLPLKQGYAADDLGRATRGSAQALLAKVYMQQQKYAEALGPLSWFITGGGAGQYSLMPNYRDNFLITSENNNESVFEWQFEINSTETTDDDVATPNHNIGSSISQFLAPKPIGFADGEAHRWIVHEFLEETTTSGARDPRLEASFLYDSTNVGGPTQTIVYGVNWQQRLNTNQIVPGVFFRKFLNDHWRNAESFRSPNNYRHIRYADVLLMYAECLNATGSTGMAYEYVDQVRARAGLAPLSEVAPGLSQTGFLDQIKHERLTELSGEGHRWTDLARWGDLGPQLAERDPAFNNFIVNKHELLPIPQLDLDINPNMRQNNGY